MIMQNAKRMRKSIHVQSGVQLIARSQTETFAHKKLENKHKKPE